MDSLKRIGAGAAIGFSCALIFDIIEYDGKKPWVKKLHLLIGTSIGAVVIAISILEKSFVKI